MPQPTERLQSSGALLRFDRASNSLKERKYQVTVTAGPDAGQTRAIDGRLVVGSHPDAGLSLKDTTVSRYHVELDARPDGVLVRDLESTNGTYLAGNRVTEMIVEDRATVTVGKTTLRIGMIEADVGLPAAQGSFGAAIGAAPAMKQLFGLLERVAPTDSTLLLLGETGTGKEVLARAVHQRSRRAARPFVVVDCGAVAPSLIESELFGHVRGSFTGATSDRNGAFLEADGGTIFLDELGELPLELQPKLLRVLESGAVRRVGEDKYRRVDVRVVAATHRDLEAELAAGRFRRDLYYRLAVVLVTVPALRDRLDDIPMLTQHFVQGMGRGDFELPRGLLARFAAYHWPGNVRELRNLVERALAGAYVETLGPEAPPGVRAGLVGEHLTDLPFKEAKERLVESFTREYLVALLEKCQGNISQAAREAGIARNYVHRLVARYGLKGHD
ncbi:MAG: sigma 54-dependent Fis family transcriptional regulator [Myxococcaceae bacterium]|nr:sigma 54-dependent Fis family transcriptional regulator [Myxococcaceae bacterium]